MSNLVSNILIKSACDLSNKLGYKLAIDINDKNVWTVSMYNEDGPADELDGIVSTSNDLQDALEAFVSEAEDEVDSDPSSVNESDDDDED